MFSSMNSEKRRHSLLLTLESNAYNITDVGPFSYINQHRTQMRTRHEQASFLSHRFIVLITIVSMCSQKSLGT